MNINELIAQTQGIYGNELVAVALYGSAARGEHIAKHSDLNVLVIVERITVEHLRREAPVARAWREAGNPPPLTLTRAEWLGSADIFPIEYADILAHHTVLAGTLPLGGIKVSLSDLRLQLEHEAMSKLLRLRHAMLIAARNGASLQEMLERSVSTMMVLFRATLRLHNATPAPDSETVCTQIKTACAIDTAAVARILRHIRQKEPLPREEVEPVAELYLETAQALVSHLNGWVETIPHSP